MRGERRRLFHGRRQTGHRDGVRQRRGFEIDPRPRRYIHGRASPHAPHSTGRRCCARPCAADRPPRHQARQYPRRSHRRRIAIRPDRFRHRPAAGRRAGRKACRRHVPLHGPGAIARPAGARNPIFGRSASWRIGSSPANCRFPDRASANWPGKFNSSRRSRRESCTVGRCRAISKRPS